MSKGSHIEQRRRHAANQRQPVNDDDDINSNHFQVRSLGIPGVELVASRHPIESGW